METIRRDKTIKYREKIYHNGEEIKSPLFTRKTDAHKWKRQKLKERDYISIYGEVYNPFSKLKFEGYAIKWVSKVKIENSIKTYKTYESNVRVHLIPFFGNMRLVEISSTDGEEFVKHLIDNDYRPKGIKNVIQVLKVMMNRAKKEDLILKSPFEYLKTPKVPPKTPKYFSKEMCQQFLLANMDDELYPLYLTVIYTGMRRGELAALKWDKVDFDQGLIEISATRDQFGHRDTPKNGKVRFVPIHNGFKDILLDAFNNRSSDYVFVHRGGTKLRVNHVYRYFREAQSKAGIPLKQQITFHQLRDTFASNFMMQNGEIYDLQIILGHHSTSITKIYAHLSPGHLANTTQNLDFGCQVKSKDSRRPYIGHKKEQYGKLTLLPSVND
jgi:integrase